MRTIKIVLLYSLCSFAYSKTVCGFNSVEDAAKAGIESVYEKSMSDRNEWAGCVRNNKNEYCYYNTHTNGNNRNNINDCDFNKDEATFHTHPPSRDEMENDSEHFSPADLYIIDQAIKSKSPLKLSFVGTANGKIISYDGNSVQNVGYVENENKKFNDQYASNDQSEIQNDGNINDENNTKDENCGFKSLNAAAKAGLNEIYDRSMSEKKEWGGCITKKSNNSYCYNSIQSSKEDHEISLSCYNDDAATFHTHPNLNDVSDEDKKSFNEHSNDNFKALFVSTPNGSLLKYDGEKVKEIGRIKSNGIRKNNNISKGQLLFAVLFLFVFGYFMCWRR